MTKVLYIGGTGQISFDCIHASVQAGHETWVFNRGNNNAGLPAETKCLRGDMHVDNDYQQIAAEGFDVICQFHVFTPEELQRDLNLFAGVTSQYVFISSASCYEKPVRDFPITEKTPLINPYWGYSQAKIECEALLTSQSKLPYTIVRPSHTSRTSLITAMGEGDAAALRMLAGKPVIVPGDGTSLWTITAASDFAKPFVKLLGNDAAIDADFHLTADNAHPWNAIYNATAEALGVEADLVHVPTDTLVRYRPAWEGPLLGDKSYTVMFDNSKLKSVVGDFSIQTNLVDFIPPRVAAFRERVAAGLEVDADLDALFDRIAADQRGLGS